MKNKTALILLLCMAFTFCSSAQIPASSYMLTDNGTTLMLWRGEETKIDMEADPVLKKVTTILAAFQSNHHITTIKLPESLINIKRGAFNYCVNLTDINIPSSVIHIGEDAFRQCYSLTSITLPKSLNHIGAGAFHACEKLTSIDLDPLNNTFTSKEGVIFTKSQDALICYPAGKREPNYTIPQTTKKIESEAFAGCKHLKTITIHSAVNQIQEQAFYVCDDLTSISVDPKNSHFSSIEGVVFNKTETSLLYYPTGKTDLSYSIPTKVTYIGAYAFEGARSLTTVIIPKSVTKIGHEAFYHCKELTSVTISNSVTQIGDRAFFLCYGLTEITIPASVEIMGQRIFAGCSRLTKINVDPKNTNFSSNEGVLFNKSQDLLICYPEGKSESSYTVPLSTKKIGPDALEAGKSLKEIRFLGGVPSFSASPFNSFFIERIIVPKGTLGAYKAALKGFADKIVEGDYSTSALRVTKPTIRCYPTIVTDQLVVESDSEIKQLTLLNSAGGAVLTLAKVNSHRTTLQLSTLPHGIYLLTVKSDRGDTTTKIIKR